MFNKIYEQDKQMSERFDELTHRVVLLERNMNSDKKRITKLETSLFTLLNLQGKIESAIKLMDQKIIALIRKLSFNHGGGATHGPSSVPSPGSKRPSHPSISHLPSLDGDGSDLFEYSPHDDQQQQLELDNILQASIGDFHLPLDPADFIVPPPPTSTKYESPIVREKKSLLRSMSLQKQSSSCIPEENECDIPTPKAGEGPKIGTGRAGDGTSFDEEVEVDSQVLMEEYLLEKIEALDSTVQEEVLVTINEHKGALQLITKQMNDLQANEMVTKYKSPESLWKENEKKEMSLLLHQMNGAAGDWRRVFDELDRKVDKIHYLTKQGKKTTSHGESEGEDKTIYSKLFAFRIFLKEQMNIIESQLDREMRTKEEILTVMVPFFDELANRSLEIKELESSFHHSHAHAVPASVDPMMTASMTPTQLPELITQALTVTSPFQESRYTKQSLHQLIQQLQHEIDAIKQHSTHGSKDRGEEEECHRIHREKMKEFQQEQENLTENLLQLQQLMTHNHSQVKDQMTKNYSEIMKRITAVSQLSNKNPEMNQKIEKLTQELDEVREKLSNHGREDLEGIIESFLNEMQVMKNSFMENESHLLERLKKKADHHEIDK
jgi:hypothetical protein